MKITLRLMKFIGILFLFLLVLFSCVKVQAEEETPPHEVRVVPVTTKETIEEIKGFGSLSFLKKFEIVSPAEGILEVLYFREGDRINRGDIIGKIKNPQITLAARRAEDACSQARSALDLAAARLREGEFNAEARILDNEKSAEELLQSEKALEEEKRKNQNMETLYAAGGLSDEAIREERFRITAAETRLSLMKKEFEIRSVGFREKDLDAAGIPIPSEKEEINSALVRLATAALRAETGAAVANLEVASRESESCRLMETELFIKSPGSGVVGARYIEEGERLKQNDRLLTVMDTGSLYALFPVPESDVSKLKKGMTAHVITSGDETYEGTVDLIFPQADNQSFTFLVRVLLESGNENQLKPGMFARVIIPLEGKGKITVVPETALTQKKETAGKVFTVINNVISERNVVFGTLSGDEREIVSGLTPGEVIVLFPDAALKEGVYVLPKE